MTRDKYQQILDADRVARFALYEAEVALEKAKRQERQAFSHCLSASMVMDFFRKIKSEPHDFVLGETKTSRDGQWVRLVNLCAVCGHEDDKHEPDEKARNPGV